MKLFLGRKTNNEKKESEKIISSERACSFALRFDLRWHYVRVVQRDDHEPEEQDHGRQP
jgi:hypothetical protein